MAVGIIDGIAGFLDVLSIGSWLDGTSRLKELDEHGAMRAMLFVLFADHNLSDDEIAFLHAKKGWMPEGKQEDLDKLIDNTVEELKQLDDAGRDAYAKKRAEEFSSLVEVQRDTLVLCCIAASVDEAEEGPQHAAFEQLAKLLRWTPERIEELARKRLSAKKDS